jgi:hypothetical protein
MKSTKIWSALVTGFTTLVMSSEALAQHVIVYRPPAVSVPTLSEAMLIVLGLTLAAFAYRTLRNYPCGRPLASIAALAIVLGTTFPNLNVISGAYSAPASVMNNPAGGTLNIETHQAHNNDHPITNTSGAVQQIQSITPATGCTVAVPTLSPQCTVGSTVANTAACYVRFTGSCAPG